MFRPTPLQTAQHHRTTLVVTPGLNGYRIALVGDGTFEVVEEIPSLDSARDAHAAACGLWAEFTDQRKALKGAL